MKTLRFILAAGALAFATPSLAGDGARTKGDTAAFGKIVRLVESRQFRVEATDAYPTGNSSVTIESRHGSTTLGGEGHVSLVANRGELVFRDSVVTGRLPFFGRAYSLPYGEGGGFELEGERVERVKIKSVHRRAGNRVEFSCSVTVRGDVLSFSLEAYENGTCFLHVNSNNRAAISYGGRIDAIGDVLSFSLEAYENGTCFLHVNSNNRAAISYGGRIDAIEDEEVACAGRR
ncbi:MAG: DUF4251 domain-containing protein [Odoribacteraceae bacterium]|jgi:hypothetical protein|nr:DUF4251 domain-containing protein [Odoribacteraceae bacterium]